MFTTLFPDIDKIIDNEIYGRKVVLLEKNLQIFLRFSFKKQTF